MQDRIGWFRGNKKKLCRDIRVKSTIRSATVGRAAKVSLFSSPKDLERRKKWANVVRDAWLRTYPGEKFKLNENFFICELHFREVDLVRKWTATDKAGKVVHETLYKKPRLVDGALPQGDLPEKESSNNELEIQQGSVYNTEEDAADFAKISKSATIEHISKRKHDQVRLSNQKKLCTSLDSANKSICNEVIGDKINYFFHGQEVSDAIAHVLVREFPKPVLPAINRCSRLREDDVPTVINLENATGTDLFQELLRNDNKLKLPSHWTCTSSFGIETFVVFSQLMMIEEINFNTPSAAIPTILKQVFFSSDLKLKSAILSMKVDLNELLGYDTVNTMDELLKVISEIDAMRFCHGAGGMDELDTESTNAFIDARGKWRSKKCLKLLPPSNKIYCKECTHFRNLALRNIRLRKKKIFLKNGVQTSESSRRIHLLNKLRDRIKSEQRSKNRQKVRVRLLTEKIGKLQDAMKKGATENRQVEQLIDEDNGSK